MWILCFLLASLVFDTFQQDGPLISLDHGQVRGTYYTSFGGKQFASFQGIPYARPPTGKRRFKDPAPMKPWRGIWPATNPGSACLQYGFVPQAHTSTRKPLQGDEDCLYINVYSPRLPILKDNAPLLDVIVNIHGDGFTYGKSNSFGPKYLVDLDIILVTFNYRLGPLGFLSTEDEVVPGNMGLKDQVTALHWVQKNIAAFGGNNASVTLTGQSAGAASVHFHYLSPLSNGLFKQGISQSGSALCPWAQMENGREKTVKLAQALGCSTLTSKEMVDCLRYRPAALIVQQISIFQEWLNNPLVPFGPTIEVAGIAPFLNRQPIELLLSGNFLKLPWIVSVTTEEGLFPAADWVEREDTLNALQISFDELAPLILDYNYTVLEEQKQAVAESIHKFYFKGKPIAKDNAVNVIRMVGDRLFVMDIERAARLHAAVDSSHVYFYQFGYRGLHSFSEYLSGVNKRIGSSHGDDVAFIFETAYSNTQETQQDKDMSKLLLGIWKNFVSTGHPISRASNFTWRPITPHSKEMLYLFISNSSHLEMKSSLDLGNRVFWDTLPIDEPQITMYPENLNNFFKEEL